MQKGLVSIIVPVYNVEDYLERCLESIIHQTYENIEIILIDDGSDDQSGLICDRYAAADQRMIVRHIDHSGQAVARNTALDLVRGECIAFVDSDDSVDHSFVEKLYRKKKSDNADFVICEYCSVDEAGNKTIQRCNCEEGIISKRKFWELETTTDFYFCAVLWNKMFSASLWNDLRFIAGKYAEDSFAMTSYIKKAKGISVVKEPLYQYTLREGSLTHIVSAYRLDAVEAKYERLMMDDTDYDLSAKKSCLYQVMQYLSYFYIHLDFSDPRTAKKYHHFREKYKDLYRKLYNKTEYTKRGIKCYLYYKSDRLYYAMTRCYRFFCK